MEATEPERLVGLSLSEGLGPLLPARCNAGTARFAHIDATPLWTEHEVRAMLAAERERCAMKLQVTRSDVQLAAGEISNEEWHMCAAILRWMQSRIHGSNVRVNGELPHRSKEGQRNHAGSAPFDRGSRNHC